MEGDSRQCVSYCHKLLIQTFTAFLIAPDLIQPAETACKTEVLFFKHIPDKTETIYLKTPEDLAAAAALPGRERRGKSWKRGKRGRQRRR